MEHPVEDSRISYLWWTDITIIEDGVWDDQTNWFTKEMERTHFSSDGWYEEGVLWRRFKKLHQLTLDKEAQVGELKL